MSDDRDDDLDLGKIFETRHTGFGDHQVLVAKKDLGSARKLSPNLLQALRKKLEGNKRLGGFTVEPIEPTPGQVFFVFSRGGTLEIRKTREDWSGFGPREPREPREPAAPAPEPARPRHDPFSSVIALLDDPTAVHKLEEERARLQQRLAKIDALLQVMRAGT